jgi:hypothetical protein
MQPSLLYGNCQTKFVLSESKYLLNGVLLFVAISVHLGLHKFVVVLVKNLV